MLQAKKKKKEPTQQSPPKTKPKTQKNQNKAQRGFNRLPQSIDKNGQQSQDLHPGGLKLL